MRWLFLSLVFLTSFGQAKTSLWQVSNGTHSLYIGGTIHMLSENDFPLPGEFDRAYRSADVLVLETDLFQLSQPKFQKMLMRRVSYPDGQTLKTQLQPHTYQRVSEFLARHGLSIAAFERIKPSMLSISLSVMEMKRLGLDSIGVDQYFYQRARQDGMPTRELEKPEDQIEFIANMGAGKEDELLLNTLRDLENLRPILQEIKQSWRNGEESRLARAALVPMQQDYPQLYQELLVERNKDWLPQIVRMLKTGEIELVLVGALHLVGEEGLLKLLSARGYRVVKVDA
jgi:uncharacterized protein YbaP (TraB family)